MKSRSFELFHVVVVCHDTPPALRMRARWVRLSEVTRPIRWMASCATTAAMPLMLLSGLLLPMTLAPGWLDGLSRSHNLEPAHNQGRFTIAWPGTRVADRRANSIGEGVPRTAAPRAHRTPGSFHHGFRHDVG